MAVDLDCRFGLTESGPREQAYAEVYHRCIQGVDDLVDLLDVSFLPIQLPGHAQQDLGEFEVDPPVAVLVGVGQIAFGHVAADAHRVEQPGLAAKACLDVSQTLSESELSTKILHSH